MSWKQSRSGKRALGNLRSALATLLFLALNSAVPITAADGGHCAVCGATHGETVYAVTDRAAARKVLICYSCVTCPDECYVCGLPVPKDPLKLSDGRCLCERDRKTVILEEEKAQRISEEVRDGLDRQFSRFLSLPSTNVTVRLVDRVDLYEEFAVTGNNFECPEILGYIHAKTNRGGMTHSISLMTALQEAEFRATCAHEYAHAWLFENVSTARRKALSRDAQEGFCELLAYLLMDAIQQGDQMERMLRNTYTRGQIQLFIAAEREYGINEVLDWMRWGVNTKLKEANLADIRNVQMPRTKPANITSAAFYHPQPQTPAPASLLLKGISSARNRSLALINNESLAVGESARVRVGSSNVLVKCLEIRNTSARVKLPELGEELELSLQQTK